MTETANGNEDSDQLPLEDTLLERGVSDVLDEGITVPEYDRANHFGETALEEARGEPLEARLDAESPEVWEAPDPEARDLSRTGRLVADTDAEQGRDNDIFTTDVGIDGAGASAEEAAMHVIDDTRGFDDESQDEAAGDADDESQSNRDSGSSPDRDSLA